MRKGETLKKYLKNLRVLPLAAMLVLPMSGFAQDSKNAKTSERPELGYKQRHSKINQHADLFADGIKIKRDLSILKEAQEERILAADEIPAEELYGGIWTNNLVNSYKSVTNAPDTFTVDLRNFTMPVPGYVTSEFGQRRRRMHYGMDLKLQVGDTVYAAFDGKIRMTQFERRGYGNYVVMRHSNGLETVYGHLSKFLVNENDVVKSGDPIALGGNTGRSTGAHLHWEFRYMGRPIHPREIIDFDNKVCHRDTYTVSPRSFAYSGAGKFFPSGSAPVPVSTSRLASSKTSINNNKYTGGQVTYHRIRKGDTLGAIARKNGTTVSKICKLNNITAKSILREGKSLRVL